MSENPFMDWMDQQRSEAVKYTNDQRGDTAINSYFTDASLKQFTDGPLHDFSQNYLSDIEGGATRALALLGTGGNPTNLTSNELTRMGLEQMAKRGIPIDELIRNVPYARQDAAYMASEAFRHPDFARKVLPAGMGSGTPQASIAELIARVMGTSMMNTSPELFQWLSPEFRPPNPDRA